MTEWNPDAGLFAGKHCLDRLLNSRASQRNGIENGLAELFAQLS